jgi:hypothetical protein
MSKHGIDCKCPICASSTIDGTPVNLGDLFTAKKRVPIELEFDFTSRVDTFGMAELPKGDGVPRITVNMAAILHCAAEHPDIQWREMTADVVLHELLHVLQWATERVLTEGEVRAIEERLAAMRGGEDIEHPDAAREWTVLESLEEQLDAANQRIAELQAMVQASQEK